MTIYFTSDQHYFHSNVIKHCNRPFADVETMNMQLIYNYNKLVQPNDTVYHLGDFGLGKRAELQEVLNELNGIKRLIAGNHDPTARKLSGWDWVKDYYELKYDGQLIVLFHYAMRVWRNSHYGSLALYGHSHGSMPGNSQSLDVGVDCWNYKPVTYDEITKRMSTLPKYTGYREQAGGSDHHQSLL
jgi:calcineurin-like phosphoesterase family protein